jgi:hypothetical protein
MIGDSESGKCFSSGGCWRGLVQLAHLALLAESRQLTPECPPELIDSSFVATHSKLFKDLDLGLQWFGIDEKGAVIHFEALEIELRAKCFEVF